MNNFVRMNQRMELNIQITGPDLRNSFRAPVKHVICVDFGHWM